jgi:hypothetical protein
MIRRMVLAAVAVTGLLGGATPSMGQQAWVEYRSAASGYRVEFPGQPKIVPMDVKTADGPKHLDLPQMTLGDMSFVTGYADLSGTPPDAQAYLDTSRDGTLASTKGKLRSQQRLTIGSVPARRFVYDMPDKSVVTHLTVLSGRRIYQLEAIGPADQANSAVVQHFIGSFALVAR